MKFYIKWFYGYKNFGDEVIFFWLLNYLQQKYNPDNFTIEVWDSARMQKWIQQNLKFLDNGILDKIDLVENVEISRRFRQFQSFLWIDKYKKFFKIFGGWEVLDESRKFPHDGWNFLILNNRCIQKWNFILVWWIGTDIYPKTKFLFKRLLPKAKEIICRESVSLDRAKKYWAHNVVLFEDFSKKIFEADTTTNKEKVLLINLSPKYNNEKNVEKINNFVKKYGNEYKKIYFPADINFDKQLFYSLRAIIPDIQVYDWTKHDLQDTINLFLSCTGGIGSRLHFLYPLKLFSKDFECIADSDKVKKIIINP